MKFVKGQLRFNLEYLIDLGIDLIVYNCFKGELFEDWKKESIEILKDNFSNSDYSKKFEEIITSLMQDGVSIFLDRIKTREAIYMLEGASKTLNSQIAS